MTWRPESEEAMAEVLVAWLARDGWDVHQEVKHAGSVADVVAVRGPLVWIIECKLSLGFPVLAQLDAWRRLDVAHLLSAAVPASDRSRNAAAPFLPLVGLGLLQVGREHVYVNAEPPFRRCRNAGGIRARLCEQTRTFAKAGNAAGRAWTPFLQTAHNLVDILKHRPGGLPMRGAMLLLKGRHHYASDASARSSLGKWVERGKVPGVRLEFRDGAPYWLYDAKTAERRPRWG